MSTMTLLQRNGSAKGMQSSGMQPDIWLQQSVQQFFQSVNWEGRVLTPPPAPVQELEADSAPVPAATNHLDLTMSVSDYFNAIPWDGVPVIAAPVLSDEPEDVPSVAEKEVTLDDFFSSF
jgi:hypothetical protein